MPEHPPIEIHRDITRAATLPAWCYRDPAFHERLKETVFARSWQWIGGNEVVPTARTVHPFVFLDGCLSEPLVVTRDGQGVAHCMSNVCTHRGNLVVTEQASCAGLQCGYHGRRFGLDGAFVAMPEFLDVRGFPSPKDDLARVPVAQWRQFLFAALEEPGDLLQRFAPVEQRTGFLPWDEAALHEDRCRDYEVEANWMLYCDNYLEGFHIPYVHPSLCAATEHSAYRTECFEKGSVQIAAPGAGGPAFRLPAGHPDAGTAVAAWYFWLWPNLMLNVYPWGCSVNIVVPLSVERTRVLFRSYVWDASKLDVGAGQDLDRVEQEDERIVESVQRGVRSRFYDRGRYAPQRERCVHHFHRLVAHAAQ